MNSESRAVSVSRFVSRGPRVHIGSLNVVFSSLQISFVVRAVHSCKSTQKFSYRRAHFLHPPTVLRVGGEQIHYSTKMLFQLRWKFL